MAQVLITNIESQGLSILGTKVLKAALTYAQVHRGVKRHGLQLREFCDLAGLGKLSGDAVRVLLYEAQRVLACVEAVDTEASGEEEIRCGSSPMFNWVSAGDDFVEFEVPDFVLHAYILPHLLAMSSSKK